VAEPLGSQRDEWHRPRWMIPIVAAVAAALLVGVTGLPRDTAALSWAARHAMRIALPRWGTTEVVS
jgi:multicomponent Na+:H+ antiporter subunit B